MSLSNFFNPVDKNFQEGDVALQELIIYHTGGVVDSQQQLEEEDEDEFVEIAIPTARETLQASQGGLSIWRYSPLGAP